MAPAPEGKRKAFDLSNPGVKEYLIVGGVAVGAFFVWQWWKAKTGQAAPSSPGQQQQGGGRPSPSGLSTSQFMAWIRDHQSSPPSQPPEDEPAAHQPPAPRRLPPHPNRGA